MPALPMAVARTMVPAVVGSRSLVGVGRDRPLSFGNYFEFYVGGKPGRVYMRCVNMWAENLETWAERNDANVVECVVIEARCGRLAVVVDDRVGEDWLIHGDGERRSICLTGAGCVPRAMIEEACRHAQADPSSFVCGCEEPDQSPLIHESYSLQDTGSYAGRASCGNCGREWDK